MYKSDVNPEDFNQLFDFIKAHLETVRATLNVNVQPKEKKVILPDVFGDVGRGTSVESGVKAMSIDDAPPKFSVVDLEAKRKLSVKPFVDVKKLIGKVHKQTSVTQSPKTSTPDAAPSVSKLDFISDKTHTKSKQILQDIQDLNDYVVVLKNMPHQALNRRYDGNHKLECRKRKITEFVSITAKTLCYPYKAKRSVPKIDMAFYVPNENAVMFDFSTPCPY